MRRLLAAVAVLTLTACINDSVGVVGTQAIGTTGGDGSSNASVAGTYTLKTVGGLPLPYTYQQSGADKTETLDDVITLTTTGTWSELLHERQTLGGVITVRAYTDAGTYVQSGTGVTFRSPNGDFSGVFGTNSLTLFGPSPSGQTVAQFSTK